MPHRVAIFCKSFDEDFARLAQLLQSYQHHCADMPFVLSIPRAHDAALRRLGPLPSKVVVIFDEDYAPGGMQGMYGWFQQQICKLSVHKTGLAEAYVSVDSDAYFVAPLDHGSAFDGGRKRIVYAQLFTKYQPGNDGLRRYLLDPTYEPDVEARPGTLEGFGERLAGFRLWLEKTGDVAPIERGG